MSTEKDIAMNQKNNNKGTVSLFSSKIQLLRGLAIIAVVCIHCAPHGEPQIWIRPFINFCVGLFLFLSGILSNANRWNPKKRIIKVIIPYIIWTVLYVLLRNFHHPAEIPMILVKDILTTGAAGMMYYIFVYCEFTLLIPLIDKLARSKLMWIGFLISPIEIVAMRLLPLVLGVTFSPWVLTVMKISFVGWFSYFYLGYVLGNKIVDIKIKTAIVSVLLILSIALQIAEGYLYLHLGAEDCGTQLKLSALISGMIFMILVHRYLCSEKAHISKVLIKLGDYSFGIFFIHLLVLSIVAKVPVVGVDSFFPINAVLTIAISFVLVVCGKKVLGKYSKYLAL